VGYSLVVLFGFFHGACFRLFLVARQIGLSIALHHFYFFFGQAVQLVNELVNLVFQVGGIG
jgi:hypothetical protein